MAGIKRLANPHAYSRKQLLFFVLVFAALGYVTLHFTKAEDLSASTDAHTVIVQHTLPHLDEARDKNDTPTVDYPPFTLYGDGQLICGDQQRQTPGQGTKPELPRSTKLSPDQINQLIQQIADTGFLGLKHEYFKLPIAERQEIVRVNLTGGDHFVMYYGDVTAPAAYTATLKLLTDTCAKVRDPYVPAEVTLLSKQVKPVPSADNVPADVKTLDPHAAKAQLQAMNLSDGLMSPGAEAPFKLSGEDAKAAAGMFHGKAKGLIKKGGAIYSTSIIVHYPTQNNPLKVDYQSIRDQDSKAVSLIKKARGIVEGKAYAASTRPVRVVILVPKDIKKYDQTGLSFAASAALKSVKNWYCLQVGSCYDSTEYQDSTRGYSFISGNLRSSQYTTCPTSSCVSTLDAVMENVIQSDSGTVYRSDVDTLVMTAWATNTYTTGSCGIGMIGPSATANISVVDPLAPTYYSNNTDPHWCPRHLSSAHELGHNFGLSHTCDGTLMDGSPCSWGGCVLWTEAPYPSCNLDGGQIPQLRATSTYFPPIASASSNSVPGGLSNLYKYYNSSIIDNLYSTNRFDAAKSSYGYSYQGCVGQLYNSQASGTVPLYRYFSSGSNGAFGGDSFYTLTRNDSGYAAYGYSYVGITGYVYSTQQPGTVALNQYWSSAPKSDHFYTTQPWSNGFLDYYFQNTVGYVYPPPLDKCGPTDPAPASPQLVPLYHYYSPGQVDNFYTAGFGELGYGAAGYDYHGCSAWLWNMPVPGSEPLYRYYNPYGGDHFYTVDRNDAGYAYYGYTYYEGVVGYVFPDGRIGGTTALNRYFAGGSATDHYYTEDAWTNGFLGYYFERTEAYAYNYHNYSCPH